MVKFIIMTLDEGAWQAFYDEVCSAVDDFSDFTIYFRGHSDGDWPLLSGLGRVIKRHNVTARNALICEQNYYFDFLTFAGDLIPRSNDSWDNLFLMQHHGLPTRLLDWTESFGIALFFALANDARKPAIWILNTHTLNTKALGVPQLLDVDDLPGRYDECFLRKSKEFTGDVLSVRPRRHVRRLAQQLAGFTLHIDLATPLEDLRPEVLRKLQVPPEALAGARRFLKLSGISEYTLFPDLDGLARHLKRVYPSA